MANLLLTGGGGFIGSHCTLCLLVEGHDVVVLDSFVNSDLEALRRVAHLAGLSPMKSSGFGLWSARGKEGSLTVIQGDVRRPADVERAMSLRPVHAVLHFAGLKALAESIHEPLLYWDVNVHGSRCLLEAMRAHGCRTLIFSSSATLYGYPASLPIRETAPVQPLHPYGHTKAAVEQLLADLAASEGGWRIARLRYFNPVGAHPSGRIGEDPRGVPTNLFPLIGQVAMGQREALAIYGTDWPTADGSGVRDFIHVMDLAEGHQCALNHLLASESDLLLTLNLGTGQGVSVMEMVRTYAEVSGRPIPQRVLPRREGDTASSVADASLALEILGWRTRRTLADICRDGWRWHSSQPRGYGREAPLTPPPRPTDPEAAGENHPLASRP
ncbi:MAG: UDP-glucose 4-epimerase GalE [Cyanobacteria bacterium K_Offshore_surface_m2_239]|nr:UDP-glucose 4-epimerase GalE [Cyanobacteria bacterium K_Offshore_surface_m2_239]